MTFIFVNFRKSDSIDNQTWRGIIFVFDEYEQEKMRWFCCEVLAQQLWVKEEEVLIYLHM